MIARQSSAAQHQRRGCPCCGNRATSAGLLVLGVALSLPSPLLQAAVCAACQQLAIVSRAGRQRLARRILRG